MKRVLFFSSVSSKKLFVIQKFYYVDILALRDIGYTVQLSNSILDFLRFDKYDVGFIYFYRKGLFAALLAKLFGKKVVFTGGIDFLHKESVTRKQYFLQKYFFLACNIFSDANIFISKSDKQHVLAFKRLNEKRNPISYHAINVQNFVPELNTTKGKIVTTIGWMAKKENVYRKGIDRSVRAFSELKKLDPEFKMYVVGTRGEGSAIVEQLANDLNISDSVELTGAISEGAKTEILKKSSVYLQLSTYEGFGIAAIEAMAARAVVFHSNVGGLNESVGSHGIIVPDQMSDRDVAALILSRYKSKNAAELLDASSAYVRNNFSYESRCADFKRILTGL